jgi:hypothetical protein|tara:strand:- start:21253 stop:21579 length:327 start_codon:yes stop_codon:yes gene_type:complete
MARTSLVEPYVRKTSADGGLERVQNSLENSFRSIQSCLLLDGHLLRDINLAVGDNTVAHKLGRILQGWLIVRKSGPIVIYDKQAENANTGQVLTLNATIAGTVSLWVF